MIVGGDLTKLYIIEFVRSRFENSRNLIKMADYFFFKFQIYTEHFQIIYEFILKSIQF